MHATICTNNNNINNINNNHHFASSPTGQIVVPHARNFSHHINGKSGLKSRTKLGGHNNHHHHHSNIYQKLQQQQQQQANNIKLNTTILNQLNPNLSAEQKLSRTMNHVEKWLFDREQQKQNLQYANLNNNNTTVASKLVNKSTKLKLQRSKSKEEIPIRDKVLLDIVDPITKKTASVQSTPTTPIQGSVAGGAAATANTPQSVKSKVKSTTKPSATSSPEHKKGFIMEYASIPVNGDATECENLLRGSDEETNNQSGGTPSTVHRYVHEHIHHHYHHFENDEA